MNNRRRLLTSIGAGALLAPLGAIAQQAKMPRIGHLHYASRQTFIDGGRQRALIQGLAEICYVEGRNFVFEDRFADGKTELLDALAAELVRMKVDLLLTNGTPASGTVGNAVNAPLAPNTPSAARARAIQPAPAEPASGHRVERTRTCHPADNARAANRSASGGSRDRRAIPGQQSGTG